MRLVSSIPLLTVLFLLMAGGLGRGASAQDMAPLRPAVVPAEGLTAYGHAEIKVKPDIAYVDLGVITQARDQAEAVRTNAAHATVVMDQLHQAGIADKDIETQFYGVEPQYDETPSPPVLTGYQVTNDVRVTVRDMTKVGLVIDRATAAGATRVNGVTFDLADRMNHQGQALVMAVLMARAKAAAMADAAGVTLGRLISLTEGTAPAVQPFPLQGPRAMAAIASPATPVAPQQITITADVTALYGIGPPKGSP